jgi:uncharacterized membrane protein YoaK (UPF0700 family)
MATLETHEVNLPRADAGFPPAPRRLSPSTVRDLLLVALTVSSGAMDAISYLGLGGVFTAFMTGNAVFLGIGIVRAGGPGFVRAIVSLAAFAVGVFLARRILRPTIGSGLWPRRVSITLGVGLLLQAAFVAGWVATAGRPAHGTGTVETLVALSALAMGLQSAAVMSLGVTGVFTTAATATLLYLVSDVADWVPPAEEYGMRDVERARAKRLERRRVAGVLAGLVAGAVAGAALLMHARAYAPVLPLIATGLVIATASVALTPPRQRP